MKKLLFIFISVGFISAGITSCKTHDRCAAYGKANKIDIEKPLSDKTEKPI